MLFVYNRWRRIDSWQIDRVWSTSHGDDGDDGDDMSKQARRYKVTW